MFYIILICTNCLTELYIQLFTFPEQLKFRPVPVNTKLELGSNTTVRCRAEGRAQPRVRWSKLDEPDLPPHVRDIDGNLMFAAVQSSDAGQYSCVASSEQGVINTTIRIDVIGMHTVGLYVTQIAVAALVEMFFFLSNPVHCMQSVKCR